MALVFLATLFVHACTADNQPTPTSLPASPTTIPPGTLTLVGHDPLFGRGMNAGLAVVGHHAYIGSRTDGAPGHPHAGVIVVDIADPARPRVVGEIGPPDQGNPGESSRELRAWPAAELLVVMNVGCDPGPHDCALSFIEPTFRFYDVSAADASAPALVATYNPSLTPHEFFLWQDPADPGRALLFIATLGSEDRELLVTDISGAREGRFDEVLSWTTDVPDPGPDDHLHSLSVSSDGTRAYLALLTAGVLVLDTTDLEQGLAAPEVRLVTPPETRPQWPGRGAHSAVKVPGRDLVVTTDEVFGGLGPMDGCPWGWARVLDVADERAPTVMSEYRVLPYNDATSCEALPEERDSSTFSSHNPTVLSNMALVSWHAAGLQAFSLADASRPSQLAAWVPELLPEVSTEDPVLGAGPDKAAMWSYPIVKDGLIYVVDVRNGLYILRYEGPFERELGSVIFLEGNSNLGDALTR